MNLPLWVLHINTFHSYTLTIPHVTSLLTTIFVYLPYWQGHRLAFIPHFNIYIYTSSKNNHVWRLCMIILYLYYHICPKQVLPHADSKMLLLQPYRRPRSKCISYYLEMELHACCSNLTKSTLLQRHILPKI